MTARSSGFGPPARRLGARAATRPCSTIRTGSHASWAALPIPNAGDVLVSAAEGCEFTDLGGRHHAGRRQPRLARSRATPRCRCSSVGLDSEPAGITDIAPLALAHFGVALPPYARPPSRAR